MPLRKKLSRFPLFRRDNSNHLPVPPVLSPEKVQNKPRSPEIPILPISCFIPFDVVCAIIASLDFLALRSLSQVSREWRRETEHYLWRGLTCVISSNVDAATARTMFEEFCEFITRDVRRAEYVQSLHINLDRWTPTRDTDRDVTVPIRKFTAALKAVPNLSRLSLHTSNHWNEFANALGRVEFDFKLRELDSGICHQPLAPFFDKQPQIEEYIFRCAVRPFPSTSLPQLSKICGSLDQLDEIVPGRPICSMDVRSMITPDTLDQLISLIHTSSKPLRHFRISIQNEFSSTLFELVTHIPNIQFLEIFMHLDVTNNLSHAELSALVFQTLGTLSTLESLEMVIWSGYNPPAWEDMFIQSSRGEGPCPPSLRRVMFPGGQRGGNYERTTCEGGWKPVEHMPLPIIWSHPPPLRNSW